MFFILRQPIYLVICYFLIIITAMVAKCHSHFVHTYTAFLAATDVNLSNHEVTESHKWTPTTDTRGFSVCSSQG